jgi:Caspase domain
MSQLRMIMLALVLLGLPTAGRSETAYFAGTGPNALPNRAAMLVGVPAYKGNWRRLDNVTRDLPAVQKVLETVGFDSPKVVGPDSAPDSFVTRALIYQHLYSFMESARATPGSVILFYFAGHGFTHAGKMYLVPADAPIRYAEDPARFAIPLTDVIDIIKATKPAVGLIVVDACRDIPFDQLASFADPKSRHFVESGGFVNPYKLTYEDNQPNIGIIYAASHGEKALDGDANSTSHFAAALVGAIEEAVEKVTGGSDGAPLTANIRDIADDVVVRVQQMTTHSQNPRPELAFGYRLPLFSTERAFKAEEKAWRQLGQQIDVETMDKIFTGVDRKVAKDRIYCLGLTFLRTYGYSYFWKQAKELVDGVYSEEAAKECLKTKTQVAAAPPILQSPTVLAPNGDVSNQPAPAAAPPVPAAPTALPPAIERGLLADTLPAKAHSKLLVVEAATFEQPTYRPQPRKVPLNAGEVVTFIEYTDAEHLTAHVRHDKHGYGILASSALASQDAAVIRVTLGYNAGQIDLTEEQRKVLDAQLSGAKATKAVSTTIRFPKDDRTTGFRRAQAIVSHLRFGSALPFERTADFVIPTIVEVEDLAKGLVALAIVIQTDVPATVADPRVQAPPRQRPEAAFIGGATGMPAPAAVRVIDLEPTK